MTTSFERHDSTNVRVLSVLLLTLGALAGCVPWSAPRNAAPPCPSGPELCARFGAEQRCECAAHTDVANWLDRLGGEAAWIEGPR